MTSTTSRKQAGDGKTPKSVKNPQYYGKKSNEPAQKVTKPKKTSGVTPGVS